jgi:hypothetical protein
MSILWVNAAIRTKMLILPAPTRARLRRSPLPTGPVPARHFYPEDSIP